MASCVICDEKETNQRNSSGSMFHQLVTRIGVAIPGPPAAIAASAGIVLRQEGLSKRLKRVALCPPRQQSRIERTNAII